MSQVTFEEKVYNSKNQKRSDEMTSIAKMLKKITFGLVNTQRKANIFSLIISAVLFALTLYLILF